MVWVAGVCGCADRESSAAMACRPSWDDIVEARCVAKPGVALLGGMMSSVRARLAQCAPTGDAAPFLAMVSISGSASSSSDLVTCLFLGGDTDATAAPAAPAAPAADAVAAPVRVGPVEPSVVLFRSGSDRNRCFLSSSSTPSVRSESDRKHPVVVVIFFWSGPDRTIVVVAAAAAAAVRSGADRTAECHVIRSESDRITRCCCDPVWFGPDCFFL